MNLTPQNPEEQLNHSDIVDPVDETVADAVSDTNEEAIGGAEACGDTVSAVPTEAELPAMMQEEPGTDRQDPDDKPLFQYNDPYTDAYTDGAASVAAIGGEQKKDSVGKGSRILLILLFLAIVGFSIFCIVWDIKNGSQSGGYVAGDVIDVQIGQQQKPEVDSSYVDENGKYSYEGIAATVMPSIVQIYTYYNGMTAGSGSGFVLSEDGYIATNAHVVIDGDSFSVIMHDDTVYDAVRVGYDSKTDIAVLKIEARGLQPVVLGDSDEAVLGEEVCALGCPAGFSGSISTGIVSGLHRKVRTESDTYEMDCIQTDAAISPGNSGGALVNLYGQVIGITSSKYVSGSFFDSGSYEGLGFAITINEALPIIEDLISQGYVSGRVRVGIQFYEAADIEEATEMELPEELDGVGVYIMAIDETMPIAQTELQVGDFIVALNGVEVVDYASLNSALEGKQGGDFVTAKCARIDEDGAVSYFTIEFELVADTSGDY